MPHVPVELRSACRTFAFHLANGTVSPALGDIEYRPNLVEYGSELEMAFAVFLNVLEVDDLGRPTNEAHARQRAAEWIHAYVDPTYAPDPPLEAWECELH